MLKPIEKCVREIIDYEQEYYADGKCEAKILDFPNCGDNNNAHLSYARVFRPSRLIVRSKNPDQLPISTAKADILGNIDLVNNYIDIKSVKHIAN